MRLKLTSTVILVLLCFSLFGQNAKTRAEFFKEFYGTLINSSSIDIPEYEPKEVPTTDLSDVIKQLESRYNIDIPASEEAKFKTVEEVAEYVNLYLQQQSKTVTPVQDADNVTPTKVTKDISVKAKKPWKVKVYGAYGLMGPLGVAGNMPWTGNLWGPGQFDVLHNIQSFETAVLVHPYGLTGNKAQKGNSFGLSFDYSSYDFFGAPSTSTPNYDANDTTSTYYGFALVLQQDLLGKKNLDPLFNVYIEEKVRFGIHSFGNVNSVLFDASSAANGYYTYGIGLAAGIRFSVFDLKTYYIAAYSPGIISVTGLPILQTLDMEFGVRLGVAFKF